MEDALLGGDPGRVRELAGQVLAGPADGPTRARALLALGTLEHYAGAPTLARPLLTEAAELGTGAVRLRALAELSVVGYRLGSAGAMTAAADALAADADSADPEQAMLVHYTRAAALAFGGDWAAARVAGLRAVDLLEGAPSLRDDPRHLVTAVLAPGWAGEPGLVRGYLDRRMDAARARGALGVLPLALSLIAGGAMAWASTSWRTPTPARRSSSAPSSATSPTWIPPTTSCWPSSSPPAGGTSRRRPGWPRRGAGGPGRHFRRRRARAPRRGVRRAVPGRPRSVVRMLEWRIAVDDGRLPRGDYPLAVAPELVEAYLALGRRPTRSPWPPGTPRPTGTRRPEIRAHVARMDGVLAADDAAAEAASRPRTGCTPTRSGPPGPGCCTARGCAEAAGRVAAREQLRAAAAGFDALGMDGWTARATAELAATGQRPAPRPAPRRPLTSQETRVALLVARGLSNRDVAAALFVSPSTVEHHVSSVLRKRGLRSRTELAAAFGDRGGSGGR